MAAPSDMATVHFVWTRPRTGEALRIEARYDRDADGWEVIRCTSDEKGDEGTAVELTASERAELDYVAGDEWRADCEAEAIDAGFRSPDVDEEVDE